MNNATPSEKSLTSLTLIPKPSLGSPAEQVSAISAAYRTAVAALSTLPEKEQKHARNRLFWGSRISARVDGVRDAASAEKLFGRCIMNGMFGPVTKDLKGNNRYCFKLNHQYFGKGKTSYVRIGDLADKHRAFLANVRIGIDFDEARDVEHLRHMAPDISNINTQFITIVMNADNTAFVEWFAGEPKKIYTKDNIHEILDEEGQIILEKVWVQLGMDYTRRTFEKKKRREQSEAAEQNSNTTERPAHHHQHAHQPYAKRPYVAKPLNSVAAVIEAQLEHHKVAEAAQTPAPAPVVAATEPSVEVIPGVSAQQQTEVTS